MAWTATISSVSNPTNIVVGESVTFQVTVAGSENLSNCTYQWQEYTTSWGNISGKTSSTMTLQFTEVGTRIFRCVVTNANDSPTSANSAQVNIVSRSMYSLESYLALIAKAVS